MIYKHHMTSCLAQHFGNVVLHGLHLRVKLYMEEKVLVWSGKSTVAAENPAQKWQYMYHHQRYDVTFRLLVMWHTNLRTRNIL